MAAEAAAEQKAAEEAEAALVAAEAAAEQKAVEEAEAALVAAEAAAEQKAAEEAEAARVGADAAAEAEAAARVAEEEAEAEHEVAEASESEASSLQVHEAETIALEVPDGLESAVGMDPVESAPEAKSSASDIEESRPLAEPRSATSREDPEDAFSDWVGSASSAVLRRALPELEQRNEREKALLVITRLSRLERDDSVEYRRKRVDALEQLGRVEEAIEECLGLASALESMQRPIEARDAYGRVLALTPGDARAQQGLQRLEEFLDEADGVEHETGDRKPYTPSHVSQREPTMIATHERPSNGTTNDAGAGAHHRNRSSAAGVAADNPRPYSGVAGGVEASSDFEALLSEFRAELSEKPTKSDSMSRTEFGASLKEMGRLDDAIRELQAAVREPSPPPLAYELLGEAFLEKGQSRIARRLLEKALTTLDLTDRELLGVLYQLGLTYQGVDDSSNALICYERIFSVDIDYRDVQVRIQTCTT